MGWYMKIASWRTTLWGGLSILTIGIQAVAGPILDDDPATSPDFRALVDAFLTWLPVIFVGVGLFQARDNRVSSQDVGIPKVDAAIERSRQR